jgi:UDP-galactopyranose mutase
MDFAGLEYLIVGAGLSGLTVAERLCAAGRKVLVIERREQIGGLCRAEVDAETGIEVHRFGTHVFHTGNAKVRAYFELFAELDNYRHRVFARREHATFPLPINLQTINMYYGFDLSPRQAAGMLKIMARTGQEVRILQAPEGEKVLVRRSPDTAADRRRLPEQRPPANLREAAIAKMGERLYEAFIEGYSFKQWGLSPELLPAALADRITVRTDLRADYFEDEWQGLPTTGYEWFFGKMAEGIEIRTGVEFSEVRELVPPSCRVVYTGPLDAYFGHRFGPLSWRAVRFDTECHPVGDYQGAAVINYPEQHVAHTRVHEYRHLRPGSRTQSRRKTIVSRELAGPGYEAEPAYPVLPDGELAQQYREAAAAEPRTTFCGRLATYRYLDMDDAIAAALACAEGLCRS